MATNSFYISLGFTNLKKVSDIEEHTEMQEFAILGVDKVYFLDGYPSIFFKEVKDFSADSLYEIAKLQHLIWNYRKVMFLFVTSKTEVRIYNCTLKPFNYERAGIDFKKILEPYELVKEDVSALEIVRNLFSRMAVDSGTLWNTENILREKISIQNRIDKFLVKSLLELARALKKNGLSEDIIHSLLMRSIFIMYLEDKGAARDTKLYSQIDKNANSYFDILDNVESTYKLFQKLEVHFNGNVFPIIDNEEDQVSRQDLVLIKNCLFDGDLAGTVKLFDWRLFRFDIIQIELLSEIYEHFLEEFRSTKKEEAGQYYTPPALVELVLNEKLKVNKSEITWNTKILDPACGSGIFLVESYKRLIKRWKNANPGRTIDFIQLKEILEQNIFGIEYDRLAIRVATFSLYLTLVEQLNPSTLWIDNSRKFPYLISDKSDSSLKKQGKNLFRADTVSEIQTDDLQVDLVVGNPPFGSKTDKHKPTKEYCTKLGFGQDLVIPFLHKAIEFTPTGSVALIFNTKVLTNTEKPFQNFRHWLLNDTYVEKIYNLSIFRKANKSFGGQLFSSAVGPVSIVFYQKDIPVEASKTIEYWAPKTYVKNSLVEGVIIDSSDIKFLPRMECQKPDSKIWKIAMWGSLDDYLFINQLNTFKNLGQFIDDNNLKKGLGLQFLDNSTKKPVIDNDIPKLPYIEPDVIARYHTHTDFFTAINSGITERSKKKYEEYYLQLGQKMPKKVNAFRRLGIKNAYQGPHVLVKEGLSNKKLCASYVGQSCTFNSKVLGISGNDSDVLKAITAIINSDISTYYLFLISASIGIEREEIKPNELYKIPLNIDENSIYNLSSLVDYLITEKDDWHPLHVDTTSAERVINDAVFDMYHLSDSQKHLIQDFLSYNADLIFNGHKSIALKPSLPSESLNYAKQLNKELQHFLGTAESVSTHAYEVPHMQPLNMIKVVFGKGKSVKLHKTGNDFNEQLTAIDKHLLQKEGKNIYIKKQYKYFDGDTVYMVKPNQKRFWSHSSAINDARDLIDEILNMR